MTMFLGFHKRMGIKAVYSIMLISILASIFLVYNVPTANSAYSGVAKPKEFYFHYVNTPVAAGGTETKYVMNTTRQFEFSTQQEAHQNALYKPIGLPKIVLTQNLNFVPSVEQTFNLSRNSTNKQACFPSSRRRFLGGLNFNAQTQTALPFVVVNYLS